MLDALCQKAYTACGQASGFRLVGHVFTWFCVRRVSIVSWERVCQCGFATSFRLLTPLLFILTLMLSSSNLPGTFLSFLSGYFCTFSRPHLEHQLSAISTTSHRPGRFAISLRWEIVLTRHRRRRQRQTVKLESHDALKAISLSRHSVSSTEKTKQTSQHQGVSAFSLLRVSPSRPSSSKAARATGKPLSSVLRARFVQASGRSSKSIYTGLSSACLLVIVVDQDLFKLKSNPHACSKA